MTLTFIYCDHTWPKPYAPLVLGGIITCETEIKYMAPTTSLWCIIKSSDHKSHSDSELLEHTVVSDQHTHIYSAGIMT